MKKIVWIASYPKSGNTYVRLFLAHYIHSKKNKLDFNLLKKIPKFEKSENFNKILNKNILLHKFDYIKDSINVQKKIINKNSQKELIFKTHHFFGEIDGHHFTNKENTKCFIYLVRDPREVLVSYSNHSQMDISEQIKLFLSNDIVHLKDIEMIVNWGLHYKSWKSFQKIVPNLFLRYEDLVTDPEKFFNKIIIFLSDFIDIHLDKKLLFKTIDLINFDKLKYEEKKEGFYEAMPNSIFFRSGKIDTWKKKLTKQQINQIEKFFFKEMRELLYIK